jgi:Holliday junction resolvase
MIKKNLRKTVMTSKSSRKILVKKASGETEPFVSKKLEQSLRNAGANNKVVKEIVSDIESWIFDGVTTKKIYSRAFSLLCRRKTKAALRYKLKQAILQLGPTGYPFEHFIGQIFERQGYRVTVGQIVQGNCISHEMDVIATKDKTQLLIECKFSRDQGKQVSIQVPLYVQSRVTDIIKKQKQMKKFIDISFSGWVVTNTRFSKESMDYGKCIGLHLVGWDYPRGKGLKDILEKIKMYPTTLLNNLNKKEKKYLADTGFVTCSQLLRNQEVLDKLNLKKHKKKSLMKELEDICA